MTLEIEQWLAPMLAALLECMESGDTFTRFIEAAIAAASTGASTATVLAEMFGEGRDTRIGRVDWIRLGQLLRDELGWDHYPLLPTAQN